MSKDFVLFRKYSATLLPLILVLVLDSMLLVANFILSDQLENLSVKINIAGRQRMLSQKIAKNLAYLQLGEDSRFNDEKFETHYEELREDIRVFNLTLNSFLNGGFTVAPNGVAFYMEKQLEKDIRDTLGKTGEVWRSSYSKLNILLMSRDLKDIELSKTIQQYASVNLQLLTLSNQLTNQLEDIARQKTYVLRAMQTLIVVLIFFAFFIATTRYIRREKYFKALMEKSSDIVLSIDAETRNVSFISESVNVLLGYSSNWYLGYPIRRLFTSRSEALVRQVLKTIVKTHNLESTRCEVDLFCADGEIVHAEMLMQVSKGESGERIELTADLRDISERKREENKLTQLAYHDELTGLMNRRTLKTHLLERTEQDKPFAVLFVDLDGFKAMNDQYGHTYGDQVLKVIAKRIKNIVRAQDHVARYGGDEFVVVLDDIVDPAKIEQVGNKILAQVNNPLEIQTRRSQLGASIGVSIYPNNAKDAKTLIKKADAAMYDVKKEGKNGIRFA